MNREYKYPCLAFLAASLVGTTAFAADAADDNSAPEKGGGGTHPALTSRMNAGFVAGAKFGGGLGTGAELGGTYVVELEAGYALPILDRSFEVYLAGLYTQPQTQGEEVGPDPRLPPPSTFNYEVSQQELAFTLGVLYRIDIGVEYFMPHVGIGPRLYLLNTQVKGDAGGMVFGQNDEQQTGIGLVGLGGVEFYLGPGAILGEISYGWAPVNSFVLRDTDVGQVNLALGYRLML